MEKRWELKIPADETKAVELSDELKKQNRNIPLPLVKMLLQRGIQTAKDLNRNWKTCTTLF